MAGSSAVPLAWLRLLGKCLLVHISAAPCFSPSPATSKCVGKLPPPHSAGQEGDRGPRGGPEPSLCLLSRTSAVRLLGGSHLPTIGPAGKMCHGAWSQPCVLVSKSLCDNPPFLSQPPLTLQPLSTPFPPRCGMCRLPDPLRARDRLRGAGSLTPSL